MIGGWLVDAGARLDFPALPWLTLFVVSLLTAIGLRWALRERKMGKAKRQERDAIRDLYASCLDLV